MSTAELAAIMLFVASPLLDFTPPADSEDVFKGAASRDAVPTPLSLDVQTSDPPMNQDARDATAERPRVEESLPPDEGEQDIVVTARAHVPGELGMRTSFASLGFSLDGAAFFSSWQDAQLSTLLSNGLVGTINAGDAKIRGFELGATWKIAPSWTIASAVLAQRARIEQAVIGGAAVEDQRLPVVPELRARVALRYAGHVGNRAVSVEVNGHYVGSTHLSFDPSLDRRSPGYVQLGASIGTRLDSSWQVILSGMNLGNSHADTLGFGNPFTLRSGPQFTPLRPRTLTLSLRKTLANIFAPH